MTEKIIRRPSEKPLSSVPLALKCAGYATYDSSFVEDKVRPSYEVLWILSGRASINSQNHHHELTPGTCYLFEQGQRHQLKILEENTLNCWVVFDGALAPSILDGFALNSERIYPWSGDPLTTAKRCMKALENYTPSTELDMTKLVYSILSDMSGARLPGTSDELIAKTLNLIALADTIPSIKELASNLDVHRSILSRRFQAAMGQSLVEYLTHKKAQLCMDRITNTNLSFKEIAKQCGFLDASYFTNFVKRVSGRTPKELRHDRW